MAINCLTFDVVLTVVVCMCLSVHFLPFVESQPSESAPMSNISTVEVAKGFNIYYGRYFKVVGNLINNSSYILFQNTPNMTSPNRCGRRLKSFVTPFTNYSVDTFNVPVSFLELLGVLNNLKGVTSKLVSSPCLAKYIADGDVQQVNQTDPKQILQFTAYLTTSSVPDQKCNYISFDPFEEQIPLQRAEWIKYVATFMNYEARANDVFERVKKNYMCLSALAGNASTKPTVAWITFDEDIWYFSGEAYKLQYVLDAGGSSLEESVYSSTFNMSLESQVESFHSILAKVDIVIDESDYGTETSNYTMQTFTQNAHITEYDTLPTPIPFPFIATANVWRYDKKIQGSCVIDWWDGGLAQPQLALGDFIQALHPQTNYTTTFLRNIAKGEGTVDATIEACTHDKSTPMEPTLVHCDSFNEIDI